MRTLSFVCFALCAVAAPARGQATAPSKITEARAHFQEGVQSAQRGELSQALAEFEAAYAVQPHFSVLYNLGQAYSGLGRPIEAVTAFERYLNEGGEQVGPARREEVEAILAKNRQRIGILQLDIGALRPLWVWIDGAELSSESLARPLPLAEGPHSILHVEPGCAPRAQTVTVAGGRTLELKLSAATECSTQLAQLAVDCQVPDVEVDVEGVALARTPLEAPLLIPVGEHQVRFQRRGYVEITRRVQLSRDALSRLSCEQRVLSPLPESVAARLVVHRSPEDAKVRVDGQVFTGAHLPAGLHQVTVEQEGYLPATRRTFLEAGKVLAVSVTLVKTPERLTRERVTAARRKKLGLALGGAGLVFLGTAGSLYVWNNQRYSAWRASASADPTIATSVQRVDDASLALTLLGAGLVGSAAWLVFGPN